jgi:putative hydrolase of HD superfamily
VSLEAIARLFFEARSLKNVPRTGYQFLGAGRESVAEHSYTITVIAFVMAHLVPDVDTSRLVSMCLVHDLPEARIGDLNYVQKQYVQADQARAVADLTRELPFGSELVELIHEFHRGETIEAQLANDADQLAFLLELKDLDDLGFAPPASWIPHLRGRLRTETGQRLAEAILATDRDSWWRQKFIDSRRPTPLKI